MRLTLGHLSQSPTLLPEVHNHSDSTPLSASSGLLDPVDEVRSAGADVGSKHVGTVALVVHSDGRLLSRVREEGRVSKDVDGHAANGREEQLQVSSGEKFGVHPAGLCEKDGERVTSVKQGCASKQRLKWTDPRTDSS